MHAEIHPPGPGPGQPLRGLGLEPPGVSLDPLPWVWAWRPSGCGSEDPLGVGLERPPNQTPQPPPECGPGDPLANPSNLPPRVWAWRPPWTEFFVLCYHHRGQMQTHADALPTHESDVAFRK